MKTSAQGIALIQQFEGFRSNAYRDPVGIWTIGYGFIKGVREGDVITKEQAVTRLKRELTEYEAAVFSATHGKTTQSEFDALVCFAFNIGVEGMRKSSVIKAHNRCDKQAAARAFGLWNKAGGKVFPGLTRRRAAESALYLEDFTHDMPQKVDAESRMSGSTINRAATLIGGTSVLTGATQLTDALQTVSVAADSVTQAKESALNLGPWLVPILLFAVAGLAGYIIWQRWKQRKEGWA